MPSWTTRMVGMVLAILICCTPEMLTAAGQTVADQAQSSTSSSTPQAGATDQQDAGGAGQSATAPDANNAQQPLPNAPRANSAAGQNPTQDQTPTQNQNPTDQNKTNAQQQPAEPAGTAAAQIGKLKGGPASKPAGAAIAPAKQRRVRSFLIKFGALAAAGAAAGTVYALSRSSPTRPPGAR